MAAQLPTFTSAKWTVTALLDSLRHELETDTLCQSLYVFSYAITSSGWSEIHDVVAAWMLRDPEREVRAYVGTDHGLTDPDALREMRAAGLAVRIMTEYSGVFHPKVFWLFRPGRHLIWVGSNNLTRDGLIQNVEFATLIKSEEESADLRRWFDNVHAASELQNDSLLKSYQEERDAFAKRRANVGTFTWSRKKEPPTARRGREPKRKRLSPTQGDLLVQVMPKETGTGGKQMQLPKKSAVVQFFGLADRVGSTRAISLSPVGTNAPRHLTLTIFPNRTLRLSINELDYRDRPCVILFHKTGPSRYLFEIISQSVFPSRYAALLARCYMPTRKGSRRWAIL